MRGGSSCVARYLTIALITFVLFACGHGRRAALTPQLDNATEPTALAAQSEVTWPSSLPIDALQPWERADGSGRIASSINLESEFVPGVEWHYAAGEVAELGEAASFASGAPGGEALSYALYRIPLGSGQPGTIAADVNLHAGGSYYIGVADYSANTWRWHGPFSAPHVRIALPHYEYTSEFGNLFIAAVAYDGAAFDLVGLGVNARDDSDSLAPSIPEAPILTPVAGGLHVRWLKVDEEDLAGYRVYTNGEEALGYVEGGTSVVIPLTDETEITLTAIDLSGNESEPSEASIDSPLTGAIPTIELTASAASGGRNAVIELTASGADTYDWDVDGDGNYDITGDATGTATAATANLGIIRPALRGHTSGGGFSLSAVSLIIGGNSRPVAAAYADPASGYAPLDVTFTGEGEDEDGTIDAYAWDFDGDGIYDSASQNPPPHQYSTTGLYNAKFRVTDDEGAWDVDTVAVQVLAEPTNLPPVALLTADETVVYLGETGSATVNFDASGSYDPEGGALTYAFDPLGVGQYTSFSSTATLNFVYANSGSYQAGLKVEDDAGSVSWASQQIRVYRFGSVLVDIAGNMGVTCSLAIVTGCPAISYRDDSNPARLKYVRATDAEGSSWGTPVTVDSTGSVGTCTSLVVVNGYPAITHADLTNGDLKYVRASDANGSSWGASVTVDSAGFVGIWSSLKVVNGYPAISYYDATNGDLKYVRAANANGTSWGAPQTIDSTGTVGFYTSMSVVSGNPAITYLDGTNGDLKFVRASNANGSSWGIPIAVDMGNAGWWPSLAVVDGRPAISYWGNGDLRYVRATDTVGGSWGSPQTLDSTGSVGHWSSLAIVNGVPAISYHDDTNGALKFILALDASGSSWYTALMLDSTRGTDEGWTSLCVVNGGPAIAYHDNNNKDLKFAYPRLD